MNRETRWILLAAVCLAALGPSAGLLSSSLLRAADPAISNSNGRFVGAGSCAAASCHGGESGSDKNEPRKLSEYAVWVQHDPHATAFTALYSRRSQQIAQNLGLKEAAYKSAVCLNCHSLAADPPAATLPDRHVLEDGVSCEACHGPAADWLREHTSATWKTKTDEQKLSLGFRNTKDVLVRTTACVKCHVGGEGRDVDHDLIAAGHPRLYFEMAAYHEKMPKHWSRKTDHQQNKASDARLWLVGQFAAAEGALELLEHRASLKKPDSVWPEFAESACFACHHDLSRPAEGGPSWRQQRAHAGRADDFPWGTWHFALVGGVARELEQGADADGPQQSLRELRRIMAQPNPDRIAVYGAAAKLRLQLQPFTMYASARGNFSDDELRQLLRLLLKTPDSPMTQDWDGATQVYLGLVALAQTLRESPDAGTALASPADVFNQLRGLRDRLQFPRTEVRIQYSSPRDFDGKRIEELSGDLQRLREMLDSK